MLYLALFTSTICHNVTIILYYLDVCTLKYIAIQLDNNS